jgi:2-polyprenyl-3-methyl-5-hydroxy-6-metoxy-1,4-benzoquinol methylase
MHFSYIPSRILSAGLQLDVFSHIAAGHETADTIAHAAEASERGMRMLLDSLAALPLLNKRGERYRLTPLSRRYLVRESPDYLGAFLQTDAAWQSWGRLTDVIRSGQPILRVEKQQLAEMFFPILVRTLHVLHLDRARRAARSLGGLRKGTGLRILDIACGSAVWSIPFAEANARTRVTAQDFPALLPLTRQYAERHGVAAQYDYLPGDLNDVELGEARYDLVLLGNIVHSEGERSARSLFRRLHRALAPGGRIAIADMVPHDDRTGPAFPVFFALNMLLNTEHGGTFTLADYTRWLKDAGLPRVITRDIGAHSPLIIATRK